MSATSALPESQPEVRAETQAPPNPSKTSQPSFPCDICEKTFGSENKRLAHKCKVSKRKAAEISRSSSAASDAQKNTKGLASDVEMKADPSAEPGPKKAKTAAASGVEP